MGRTREAHVTNLMITARSNARQDKGMRTYVVKAEEATLHLWVGPGSGELLTEGGLELGLSGPLVPQGEEG